MAEGRRFAHQRVFGRRWGGGAFAIQQEHEHRIPHRNLVAVEKRSLLDRNAVYEGAVLAVMIGDAETIAGELDRAMLARDAQIGLR